MLPDPTTLALFVQAAEFGSISRAAELSNLALAAASRRISQLEQHYNVKLLARTSRGVELTAAGKALLPQARQSLNLLHKLDVDLADYARGVRGHLRIQANMSAMAQFLADDLAAFAKSHPDVRLNLEERLTMEIVDAVREGSTDIGVIVEQPHCEGMEVYSYRQDQLVLITPPEHSLRQRAVWFSDVLNLDFVALEANTALTRRMNLSALAANKPLRLRVQVRSFEAVIRMVAAGLGVGVLPATVVQPFLRDGKIRSIALRDPWSKREIYLCVRERAALPQMAEDLLSLMIDTGKHAFARLAD